MNTPVPSMNVPAILPAPLEPLVAREYALVGVVVPPITGPLRIFEQECNSYARYGWEPSGGVVFHELPGQVGTYVTQVFTRRLNVPLPLVPTAGNVPQ